MEKLVLFILQVRNQIQLLHWQTDSYAEHKAFDKYLDSILDTTDMLVESISGKFRKVKFNGCAEITICDYSDMDILEYLEEVIKFYKTYSENLKNDEDSEIKNLIDEVVVETQKLKYLLTLK